MEEDHKTKEARDQGVEKHSCQIELRGARLNLVYYNGKQVLRSPYASTDSVEASNPVAPPLNLVLYMHSRIFA